MEIIEILERGSKILIALTSMATPFIAYYVYKLSNQQRIDAWNRSFNELHQTFWQDGDFAKVRAWIANDEEYSELEKILIKRNKKEKVSRNEYHFLETLDKFFNFFFVLGKWQTNWITRGFGRISTFSIG